MPAPPISDPHRRALRLLLLAGAALAVARAALRIAVLDRRYPVPDIAHRLREGRALPARLRDPRHLAIATDRLLWLLPPWGMGRCLKRSLLLLEVWSRCRLEVRLHLGIRRGDRGAWEGHAWLTSPSAPATPSAFFEVLVV